MDLRAKRRIEIVNQKEKRREEVIAAAIEVFKEKGIENSKMTDIAEKAEVGIASVYRYFKTKQELVIEAAIRFREEEIILLYDDCSSEAFNIMNGLDRVRSVLEVFLRLYEDHMDFIRFVDEFDNYVLKEGIQPDKLENYESIIVNLKLMILESVEEGKRDGSIRRDIDNNEFYSTITHGLMSMCQKLALRGSILKSDMDIMGNEQLKMLIDMGIRYIQKN